MKTFKKIIALTLLTITITSFGVVSFADGTSESVICSMDFDLERDIDK